MERKIYERSISKHVTADGVVGDEEEETPPKVFQSEYYRKRAADRPNRRLRTGAVGKTFHKRSYPT